ncbi:MAG TPA: flippase [Chitinophaga sp.]|uniref:flippase n=1 Tax=Chitinophaga sp. TaxID=1869181 RepID=UPI002C48FB0D|nr:flippase [Chitinophaga sp.]HVI44791.1 flippase [Chitinophaga sp.]
MYKVLQNSGWLLVDKLSRLVLGLFIMAMIAGKIGPEAFGIWSFSLALTMIAGGISFLGQDKIVVREAVLHPDRETTIVATSLLLRIAAGCIILVTCLLITLLLKHGAMLYVWCTFITGLNIILQSFDVFDYYYQAHHTVQKVIIPKVGVFVLFCGIRLWCLYAGAGLLTFVWLSCLELVVTYAVILIIYLKDTGNSMLRSVDRDLGKVLLTEGWPQAIATFLILVYMKADLLLLDMLGNPTQVGEYVAAVKVSELWYALPVLFATALLPDLINKRQQDENSYWRSLESWIRLSFWVSCTLGLVITATAGSIIHRLYGELYPGSALILSVHIWAGIPVFIYTAVMQHHIISGNYKNNLAATIVGIVVNLVVNIILIPHTGGLGAAIATVLSYTAVGMVLLAKEKDPRLKVAMSRMILIRPALTDIRKLYFTLRGFMTAVVPGKKTLTE